MTRHGLGKQGTFPPQVVGRGETVSASGIVDGEEYLRLHHRNDPVQLADIVPGQKKIRKKKSSAFPAVDIHERKPS